MSAKSNKFEKECTKYLNQQFGSKYGVQFKWCGGSNSTKPDILVEKNGQIILQIEAKMGPGAQCGQFVLFPDFNNNTFLYSHRNHPNRPSLYAQKIIQEMNKNFTNHATNDKTDLNLDEQIYADQIINNYLTYKNTKFFISGLLDANGNLRNDSIIIFPTERIRTYFSITACYRPKNSGSHHPNPLQTKAALDALAKNGISAHIFSTTNDYTNIILHNYDDSVKTLPEESDISRLHWKSIKEQNNDLIVGLTIPSNTRNKNVIFSITLKNESQQQNDLNDFLNNL